MAELSCDTLECPFFQVLAQSRGTVQFRNQRNAVVENLTSPQLDGLIFCERHFLLARCLFGRCALFILEGDNILIADEPEAFAGLVVRLLRDPALRGRIATNGRRLVEEHYDWQAIGRRFVQLVESAVEEKHSA